LDKPKEKGKRTNRGKKLPPKKETQSVKYKVTGRKVGKNKTPPGKTKNCPQGTGNFKDTKHLQKG